MPNIPELNNLVEVSINSLSSYSIDRALADYRDRFSIENFRDNKEIFMQDKSGKFVCIGQLCDLQIYFSPTQELYNLNIDCTIEGKFRGTDKMLDIFNAPKEEKVATVQAPDMFVAREY
jgi:hypothetical protein